MSERELEPCPFCGGAPRSRFYGDEDGGYWGIDCCQAFAHNTTERGAIAAWNRRSPSRQSILEEAAKVAGWRDIASAPKGQKVIVSYRNRLGKWRQVMARYFEQGTLDSDETEDGFAPEGWYEESDTHEHLLRTDEPPTHWQPLLPFPDDGKAPDKEGEAG